MARDRKRAKQRRDRRPAPSRAASRASGRPERSPRPETGPSDPLDHVSAEVDLAEAHLAMGRAAADGELDAAGYRQEDAEAREAVAEPPAPRRPPRRRAEPEPADDAEPPAPRERPSEVAVPERTAGGPGARVAGFMRGSWRELQRVQWPDRRQVAQATGVVLGFVLLAGGYLGLADEVFGRLVNLILK